jgi:hypothetical protein
MMAKLRSHPPSGSFHASHARDVPVASALTIDAHTRPEECYPPSTPTTPTFSANLLDEYILADEKYAFTPDQLRELAANAVEGSFLPAPQTPPPPRIEQYR